MGGPPGKISLLGRTEIGVWQHRTQASEKAFSVEKLLAYCAAAPYPSKENKLFGCVGCEV